MLHIQHNVTAQLLESASYNVKKTHVTSPPGLLPTDAQRLPLLVGSEGYALMTTGFVSICCFFTAVYAAW
ncbi:hypothetical protein FCZ48_17415 [Escherichia coli]|nr:hypothetical protein [Escherichia coli]MDN1906228.1 hypothetical protein [Escherichia coli]